MLVSKIIDTLILVIAFIACTLGLDLIL